MFNENKSSPGCTIASGILPPAAFTSPSILPYKSTIVLAAAVSCFSSNMSAINATAFPPAALIFSTLSFATCSFLPSTPTTAPAWAIASMNAPPNMPVAPVTTITLPSNENISLLISYFLLPQIFFSI